MSPLRVVLLGSLSLSCATLFFACRWTPSTEIAVQIRVAEPSRKRMPATAKDFDCYFVNVTGSDVKPSFAEPPTAIESCSALGTVSPLLDLQSLRDGISLTVVAGGKRTVELWGVTGTSLSTCSGGVDNLTRSRGTEIYKIGSQVTDLFLNSTVEVGNDFDVETNHTNCELGTSGQPTLVFTALPAPLIYTAGDIGDVPDSSDWDGNVPPPYALGTMSGPFPASSIMGVTQALTEFNLRNDIGFTLPSMDVSAYYAIRFRIDAEGGTVPLNTSCDTGAAISGSGYHYEFWEGTNNAWSQANLGPTGVTGQVLTNLLVPPTPLPVIANDSWRTPFPSFHATVRSRDNGNGSTLCTALRINAVSADLVTKVL